MKPSTSAPATCPPPLARAAPPSLVKSRMRSRNFATFLILATLATLLGCSRSARNDPSSLTFLIESNPTNLDPRYATDSYSQRIDGLLFSGLLQRDAQMNLHGDLADTWEIPNPLTYAFHLHPGVRFQDGRSLTSTDVKSTFDF